MTYHHPENGRGGPRYSPPAAAPDSGKMHDIRKFGLPIGVLSGAGFVLWALVQISYAAGENVGAYKQTLSTLQRDVKDLKDDMREAKAVLARLDQRWAVEVRR
jgi:hypothetical protein